MDGLTSEIENAEVSNLAQQVLGAWEKEDLKSSSELLAQMKPCGCTGVTCPLSGLGSS